MCVRLLRVWTSGWSLGPHRRMDANGAQARDATTREEDQTGARRYLSPRPRRVQQYAQAGGGSDGARLESFQRELERAMCAERGLSEARAMSWVRGMPREQCCGVQAMSAGRHRDGCWLQEVPRHERPRSA